MSVCEKKKTVGKRNVNAGFPYLILAASILITAAVAYNFYRNALGKDVIRFNNETAKARSTIENKINLYIALLKSGGGFVESSSAITDEIFSGYIYNLEIGKNYPGFQAVGYTEINPKNDEAFSFGQNEKSADPSLKTNSIDSNQTLPAVVFPEFRGQAMTAGFLDAASRRILNEAFERAGKSGAAVVSSKSKLYSGDGQSETYGFFIVLPIYKQNKSLQPINRRRTNPAGFIFGAVDAVKFLGDSRNGSDRLAVEIYDRAALEPENLLARSETGAAATGGFSSLDEFDTGSGRWTIQYASLPAFAEESSVSWTLLIIFAGVFFSFLLFSIIYSEVAARINLQETAGKLLELQKQKQVLLENEQSARISAERANRTKDEFIAVVSHELKTPLNAISGWTNILRTENLPGNTKKLALEKIEKNLRAQAALVEEMLEYSQVISGTIKLNKEKINFSEILESAFLDFEPKAREKNIRFSKSGSAAGQDVSGDGAKIKLVIDNLFSNAVKFTSPRGIIEAFLTANEENIRLRIKDSGEGIDAEFLPFVFEKFRQSDASITRSSGGLGLGLSIASRIAALHHGTLEVFSEGKGKGAEFTLTLPVLPRDA